MRLLQSKVRGWAGGNSQHGRSQEEGWIFKYEVKSLEVLNRENTNLLLKD